MTRYQKMTGRRYRQPLPLLQEPKRGTACVWAIEICQAELALRKRGDRGFEINELRARLREARNA